MRQQEVFNKIGSIIAELNDQYEYLKPLPAPLDDLELELLNANANFLCDHLEILRKLNTALSKGNQAMRNVPDTESFDAANDDLVADNHPESSTDSTTYKDVTAPPILTTSDHNTGFEFDLTTAESLTAVEQKDEPVLNDDLAYIDDEAEKIQETVEPATNVEDAPAPHIDLKADAGRDHFSFIRSTRSGIIRHELELSEADTFSEDEDIPHEETVAEALAQIEITPQDIAEPILKQEEKPLTLNERIAAQSTISIQPKAVQPITDLKSAINLNDKMLFVRDLFNGYSLAYTEAIEILNRFNRLEDAERFLSVNYENKNNWADKPATKEKFYDLLKRRFS